MCVIDGCSVGVVPQDSWLDPHCFGKPCFFTPPTSRDFPCVVLFNYLFYSNPLIANTRNRAMPVCHSDVCVFGMLVWISPSKLHKCCKPAKCMISLLTQRKNTLSIEGLTCTWCNKKKQMEVCEEQLSLGAEGKMLRAQREHACWDPCDLASCEKRLYT